MNQRRSRGGAAAAALLAVLLAATAACRKEGQRPALFEAEVESAVLVTIDTWRADAAGFAGNRDASTPTLDRLAAAGRIFPRAHAHNVVTLPSHTNLLTGLYPFQHGVRDNGGFTLDPEVPTVASVLQQAGFATAAFVSAFPLDHGFGLDHGFDVYDDDVGAEGHTDALFAGFADPTRPWGERPGTDTVALARRWWNDHRGRRRFLWVHVFEPHAPYLPPEPFASRFADNPYLGEVAAADAALSPLLGPFLDGAEAPTVVVVTADHGESLGEHGELTHGLFTYEATLHVPLLLWAPGIEPGSDPRWARHVDVAPTLLATLGVAPPPGLPGRSLLAGGPEAPPGGSYFEALTAHLNLGWAPLRGMLQKGDKLIELPVPELYHLADDPGEQHNRFGQDRSAAHRLAALLPRASVWPPPAGTLSEAEAAKLQSLGYASGRSRAKERYTAEDDPKNLLPLDRKIKLVIQLRHTGRRDEAIRLARELVAARPEMGMGHTFLVSLLEESGDHGAALAALRAARAAGVELVGSPVRQLGLSLAWTGRPVEAEEVLAPLAREGDVAARTALAVAQAGQGRMKEATDTVDAVLAEHPDDAVAHDTRAFLAVQQQAWETARQHAERAVALDSTLASGWNNLGVALYNLGQVRPAVEAWRRATELDPDGYDALFSLGFGAAQIGSVGEAGAALRRFLDHAPDSDPRRATARDILKGLGS